MLSDVGEVKGGLTLGKKRQTGERLREVPYLRVANVQRGRFDLTEIKLVAASEREIDDLRLRPGDVLMNEGGDRDKLGRGWVWSGEIPECIHQNHVFRVRVFDGISPRFVSYYANSAGQDHFQGSGRQTTNLASVNKSTLSALPLPLPPEKEQHRIVAKLDAIFQRSCAAKARLESLPAMLNKLRRSILAAAFRGDLTADWRAAHPEVEPASVLLERIRRTRDPKTLPAIGSDPSAPLPFEKLPPTWVIPLTGDVGHVQVGRRRAPEYTGGEPRPYLRVANIKEDFISFDDVNKMMFDSVELETYRLRAGDILLSEGQSLELVGQSAMFRGEVPDACYQATLNRFRAPSVGPVPDYCQLYFRFCLRAGVFRSAASITTNIAHLTQDKLRRIPFILPPIPEQMEIVRLVRSALTSVDAIGERTRAMVASFAAVEQAALAKAFRGELVSQDPHDEPASVALERIRADSPETPGRGQ